MTAIERPETVDGLIGMEGETVEERPSQRKAGQECGGDGRALVDREEARS